MSLFLGAAESPSSVGGAAASENTRSTNPNSSENSPGESGSGQPSGGVNHPPPQMLADVMEEYQRANQRLVQQQNNLIPVLRNDANYSDTAERDRDQQLFNKVSRITHYLSHAQHAMSDILLNLSRDPPRQLRARLFIIPSIVQTARVQAVPIDVTVQAGAVGAVHAAAHAAAVAAARSSAATNQPSQPRAGVTVGSGNFSTLTSGSGPRFSTSSSSATTSTGTNTRRGGGVPLMLPPGMLGNASFTVRSNQPNGGNPGASAQDSIQSMVLNALNQAFRPGGAEGGEGAGPSISVSTSESSGTESTRTTQSTSGPFSSVSGASLQPPHGGVPMSPQIGSPLLGNLNSFDPFLTCSSHHLPQNNRSQNRGRLIVRNQRAARSEPNSGVSSRTSSLDRRASSFLRTRAASTQGRTSTGTSTSQAQASADRASIDALSLGRPELMTFSRMMSQFLGGNNGATAGTPAANQEVRGLMNMITGVLSQVIGSLHGENSNQTIADFLNSLPDYTYVEGDNLWSDLMMALARRLTFSVRYINLDIIFLQI